VDIYDQRSVLLRNFASWTPEQSSWIYRCAHVVARRDKQVSRVEDQEPEDIASEVCMKVMTKRHASDFADQERLWCYVRDITNAHVQNALRDRCSMKRVNCDLDRLVGARESKHEDLA
jgi:hypothetical protein